MPTYEYRCPNGHLFELFQRFDDPPSEVCVTCGASPVTKVLYPVAVHFKGSGFYSTDYGRGSGKKDGTGEDSAKEGSKEGGSGEGAKDKAAKPEGEKPKKSAESTG